SGVSVAEQQREAGMMVPAQAALVKDLDSRKTQPGHQFQAVLGSAVHLKSGVELPRGTVLLSTVVTDDMQAKGTSRLALRFTQAKLKSGKVIPIMATIMGITPPAYGFYSDPGGNNWDGRTLQMDQVDAISGVDLHSAIARSNSGVFVSNKKDDVKLSAGSQMLLAIAAQQTDHQS
ncbi:MAG: hypothetical protein KGM96_00325, partial [Acidobacteriota bacterium]|nr:hypothetical protein [Acidobacteriota bacterium]